jgi:hypothetical protein
VYEEGEPFGRPQRHPREEFDLNKGHDLCEAILILSKSEVEFRGLRAPADNFKVADGQMQVIGIQLKKNIAVYLSTKVTDARGKGRTLTSTASTRN